MTRRSRGKRRDPLADEVGTIRKDAPLRVMLVYPSPYRVAMSSLGYQTLYRELNRRPGVCCERAVLEAPGEGAPLRTLESGRLVGEGPVIALSVATEAEMALAARALLRAGIEPAEERRRGRDDLPLVVAGGPLTLADATPLAALADVVLAGEAEDSLAGLLDLTGEDLSRGELLERAAALPAAIVPSVAEPGPVEPAVADPRWLPAAAAVTTPAAEFGDMFLVEAARGCPRRCAFCVMEPSRFRPIPVEAVLARVPPGARRVGIVGAALLDHPHIRELIARLVSAGLGVSLSSLRADRLDSGLLDLLVRGGLRSLTVAADGASERLRRQVRKRVTRDDLIRAASLAAGAGLASVKLYVMIGLPGEEDGDVEELCELALAMVRALPLSLAVSPFVPKPRTTLAGADLASAAVLRRRLSLIRSRLRGKVELRSASVRGAWIESCLARGGLRAGLAALEVGRRSVTHAAWREAIRRHGLSA